MNSIYDLSYNEAPIKKVPKNSGTMPLIPTERCAMDERKRMKYCMECKEYVVPTKGNFLAKGIAFFVIISILLTSAFDSAVLGIIFAGILLFFLHAYMEEKCPLCDSKKWKQELKATNQGTTTAGHGAAFVKSYRQKASGRTEEVEEGFNWWVLLFGPVWYLYKGLLGYTLLSFFGALIAASIFGILGVLVFWTILATAANKQYEDHLVSKGYSVIKSGKNLDR